MKLPFAIICILVIQSGHKLAHAMTAQLSWHVQNCGLVLSLFLMLSDMYFHKILDDELKNLL